MLKTTTEVSSGIRRMARYERALALALISIITLASLAVLAFLMTRTLSCVQGAIIPMRENTAVTTLGADCAIRGDTGLTAINLSQVTQECV